MEAEIYRLYGYSSQAHAVQPVGLAELTAEPDPPQTDELQQEDRPRRSVALQDEVRPRQSVALQDAAFPIALLRILDAAANRAREGLRVIEDYIRFALDDRHLTDCCKQARHALADTLAGVPPLQRLAARETQADVGTALTLPAEQHRGSMDEVLAANFSRVQEALRSLEEFGKLLNPGLASRWEQLRYEAYTLQRAIGMTRTGLERLASARLYVLVDGRSNEEEFAALVRVLVEAGVHVIQLRDKRLANRELVQRARLLRSLTRGTPTLTIVNDRPDLALLADADGVHVGQEDMSVKDARTIVGPDRLVGVSTHSIQQARQAVLDGANYLGAGPTFPTATKQFECFPGLDYLQALAGEIRLPAFAIGGINQGNIDRVVATGIGRVAVSAAIAQAADPGAAARAILARLGR